MKRIHREIIANIPNEGLLYADLSDKLAVTFYKKPIAFNVWNFNLSINVLLRKGYIRTDPKNVRTYLILTEKGKHYYDIMLKGKE